MDPKDVFGVRDAPEAPYGTRSDSPTSKAQVNANPEQLLIEKVKALPPDRRTEVEDFIDFLQSRESNRRLVEAVGKASEPALNVVWDNDQDAAYDRL
jgi:Protein of unknown function (DUF2281)